MIREKKLCGLMSQAYKGSGYRVYKRDLQILIAGGEWGILTPLSLLPRKALGLLAEHLGDLPADGEALSINEEMGGQTMMEEAAQNLWDTLSQPFDLMRTIRRTPLTWMGREIWQEPGRRNIQPYDKGFTSLIDWSAPVEVRTNGVALVASDETSRILIMKFVETDETWVKGLEEYDWTGYKV